MKNYIIVVLPKKEISEVVEKYRINQSGQVLVDNLPPHVTFKRRFILNAEFSEIDLVDYFKKLQYKKFKVNFLTTEVMNDAFALVGNSMELSKAHKALVKDLGVNISTKNPEWEMEKFKIHLTLLRGAVNKDKVPKIGEVIFDRMVLYEIDPGPSRDYAKEIATIELN